MKKYQIGIVLAILVLLSVFLFGRAPDTGRPNVIIISIDSLRADHMSLYGYERATTPVIDSWAKNAAVYENYFSTSFLTPVSEVSVHTGYDPFENGVIHFDSPLRPSIPTLAEVLKKEGWQTASFQSSPEFDIYPAIKESMSRGFDLYQVASPTGSDFRGRARDPAEEAVRWLGHERDRERPFFLWLTFGSVHWPYGQDEPFHFTDKKYDGFLKDIPVVGWNTYRQIYGESRYNQEGERVGDFTDEDLAFVLGRYDDGIRRTDRMLSRLFTYLRWSGLEKHTIVVLQSQHGESLGEREYIAHYDIHEEETHVPLVVRAPGLPAGRVTALASGVDIFPTVLDLLDLSAPSQGNSLLGAPRSEVYLARTPLWETVAYELGDPEAYHYYDTAVRNERWKLIHRLSRPYYDTRGWWRDVLGVPLSYEAEYELYDLSNDPNEMTNVYATHSADSGVMELRAKLSAWEERIRALPLSTPLPTIVQPYF